MRRLLASALAAALLAPALARAGEPLDLNLARLGAPTRAVWQSLDPTLTDAQADALASDAKARFGMLSVEMALALSAAVLQPASTTGHSGFDFSLEAGYVQVTPQRVQSAAAPPGVPQAGPAWTTPDSQWVTRSMTPHELFIPSFHVRKALPFSFEIGGRLLYVSQSSYFGGQIEGKWALNEGFDSLPDLAVRAAWTQLFGQRDWNLGTGDVDLMVSKRWGVNAVTSFTPYLAARFSFVNASTDSIAFLAQTGTSTSTAAAFPKLRASFYRTTLGVRMTAYAVSMAAEATYFGGSSYSGEGAPADDEYPDFEVAASLGGALRFGFEF